MLDKLMFWKKKDDFADFDKGFGLGADSGAPNLTDFSSDQNVGLGQDPVDSMQGFSPPKQPQQPFSGQLPPITPQTQTPISMQQAPMPTPQHDVIVGKDIEIISSKLDALRASLESINQRLANLERIAYSDHTASENVGRRNW